MTSVYPCSNKVSRISTISPSKLWTDKTNVNKARPIQEIIKNFHFCSTRQISSKFLIFMIDFIKISYNDPRQENKT